MSDRDEPLAALNSVLSEIIDVVREVKQARWRISAPAELHAELDQLFDDARSWAQLLLEQDEAHGVSPLTSMATPAERTPPALGSDAGTPNGVRRVLLSHLDQLGEHVAAAFDQQHDEEFRTALADVGRGVAAHRKALAA